MEPIQGYDPWANAGNCKFDAKIANSVIKAIEGLRQHKGEFAGKPLKLEAWQRQIVGHMFGWKRPNGTRRFRRCFIFVPRKNGKTTMTAALGIVFLAWDGEPGAEVYSLAGEREQAAIVFKEASSMVEQDQDLSSAIEVFRGYKSMSVEETKSVWRVLSSDAGTKHGLNPHAYIVDEVHAQKKSELMETLETGVGSRRQPFGIYLSTADVSGPSPCNNLLEYARKVRDGVIADESFLPVLYEAATESDWKSEEVWKAANPNYGVSLKPEFIRSQCQKAIDEPSFENTFKRLHLNMQTEQEKRWLKIDDWDKCGSGDALTPEMLEGKRCFGALDLSSVSDITAFGLWFPDEVAFLVWFWVPERTAKRRLEYELWARQGFLEVESGPVIDHQKLRAEINARKEKYKILAIAYDKWNASQLAVNLSDEDGFDMVQFGQGFISMNEPSKELERMAIRHELNHFGNPVLRWMASNAQAEVDKAGNIKPVKPHKDSPLKIDGIVCLVMGIGLAMSEKKEDVMPFQGGLTFL
jgi:phage terminase large subunit-like protein